MRIVISALVLLLMVSCEKEIIPEKPSNLITEDKMAEIMYDVYILNAAKGVNRKLLEINGIIPNEYIYDKYEIDSLQFAESNNYYAYNIETYRKIIDTIKYRIEERKNFYETNRNADELKKREKRDSINSIIKKRKDSLSRGLISKPLKVMDSMIVQ